MKEGRFGFHTDRAVTAKDLAYVIGQRSKYRSAISNVPDLECRIVTLLVYFSLLSHCVYIFQYFFLKLSDFEENFPLFYVVLLFFLYLYSFRRR